MAALDADVEWGLIERAQAGDAGAARELVAAHVRLAYKIAGQYVGGAAGERAVGFEDLGQEGIFALYDAVQGFDLGRLPRRRFSTYAAIIVRSRIFRVLVTRMTAVYVPFPEAVKLRRRWRDGDAGVEGAAAERRLARAGVACAVKSLDRDDMRSEDSAMVPADVRPDPLDAVETRKRFAAGLARLTPFERKVLAVRYRLAPGDEGEVRSTVETAASLGVHRHTARDAENRAVGRLAACVR